MTAAFDRGDIVRYLNREVEILFWPPENDGFCQFSEHFEAGGSILTTDHTAKLINTFKLVRKANAEPEPTVPAIVGDEPVAKAK